MTRRAEREHGPSRVELGHESLLLSKGTSRMLRDSGQSIDVRTPVAGRSQLLSAFGSVTEAGAWLAGMTFDFS